MRYRITSRVQILLISCHLELSKCFAFLAENNYFCIGYWCRYHHGLVFFHIYSKRLEKNKNLFDRYIHTTLKCLLKGADLDSCFCKVHKGWEMAGKKNLGRSRSEMLWRFPAGAKDMETKALIFKPWQPEAGLNEEIAAEEERGHPGCQSQASGPLVVNCPQVKPCCRGATGYKTANTS